MWCPTPLWVIAWGSVSSVNCILHTCFRSSFSVSWYRCLWLSHECNFRCGRLAALLRIFVPRGWGVQSEEYEASKDLDHSWKHLRTGIVVWKDAIDLSGGPGAKAFSLHGEEYVKRVYPPRASFCISLLIDPENAYDISVRPTPEMQAAGKPPGMNLGDKLLNEGRMELPMLELAC